MSKSFRILIVVTSHARLGDTGRKTGLWLEEVAVPYRTFLAAGAHVDIASPAGGAAPIDPGSKEDLSEGVKAFMADDAAMKILNNTLPLESLDADYDAIFVAGGHGVMWDLAEHAGLGAMIARSFEAGNVVAAVCHGPAALVGVTLSNGEPLVRGRKVTGFTDEEEKLVELTDVVPFLLESQLRARGAEFHRSECWAPYAVSDGRLVTGQNPQSSEITARKVLELLKD